MDIQIKIRNEHYDWETITVPGKFEICPRCGGRGTHVNPAIDGNGLSSEDFAEDPDFEEAYFSGVYDVPCHECKGRRVVPEPYVSKCSFAIKRKLVYHYRIWPKEEAHDRACAKMGY